jgi:hypothetical protein
MIGVATMREKSFCDRPKVSAKDRQTLSQRLKIVVRNNGSWFILEPFGGAEVARGKAVNKTQALKAAVQAKKYLQKPKQ